MQQSRCRWPKFRRVTRSKIPTPVSGSPSRERQTRLEGYRVYYGDEREGEQVDSRCIIDSRLTSGLITRQVRE